MAHRLVGKAQWGIQPTLAVADQGVVQRAPLNQAGGPQLVHLILEPEGSGGGNLFNEALGGELKVEELPADGGVGKLDGCPQPQAVTGERRGKTLALLQGDRFAQGRCVLAGAQATQTGFRISLNSTHKLFFLMIKDCPCCHLICSKQTWKVMVSLLIEMATEYA